MPARKVPRIPLDDAPTPAAELTSLTRPVAVEWAVCRSLDGVTVASWRSGMLLFDVLFQVLHSPLVVAGVQ